MGTHVVATGPIQPDPSPPKNLKIAVCRWFNGIWCVHKLLEQFSTLYKSKMKNSIAFGKSTSQRIYREQHTPKIGWKLHKYRLKHASDTLDDHFR